MSDWQNIPKYPTCFVCGDKNPIGLNINFLGKDNVVEADFEPASHHCGYEGIVHGGIVSAVLDEGMGWTGWLAFGKYYLTMELKIRLRAPVRANMKYKFRGELVRRIGNVFIAKGALLDENGIAVAEGEGKYFITEA